MNRRAFLKRVSAGLAGAAALASIPISLFHSDPPTQLFDGPITWRGHTLVYDQYCPKNTIYYLNPQMLWVNRGDGWERPFA